MRGLPVLTVLARWPAPGRCKRRLTRDLAQRLHLRHSSRRSARLQGRLTIHTMSVVRALAVEGYAQPVFAVSGLAHRAARRWGEELGADRVWLQRPGSLGSRMGHLLRRIRADFPSSPALLIGTDLPSLNRPDLLSAIELLHNKDLVLGPSSDGGYWLLGLSAGLLRQPMRWPLGGINWGSDAVLDQTLAQACASSLTIGLLPQHQDIDRLSDLQPWTG